MCRLGGRIRIQHTNAPTHFFKNSKVGESIQRNFRREVDFIVSNERTMMINPSLINHLDLGLAPFGAQFEELISNMFSISTTGFGGVPRIW